MTAIAEWACPECGTTIPLHAGPTTKDSDHAVMLIDTIDAHAHILTHDQEDDQ